MQNVWKHFCRKIIKKLIWWIWNIESFTKKFFLNTGLLTKIENSQTSVLNLHCILPIVVFIYTQQLIFFVSCLIIIFEVKRIIIQTISSYWITMYNTIPIFKGKGEGMRDRGVNKDSEGGVINFYKRRFFFTPPRIFLPPHPRKISWCISNYWF